MGRHAHAEQAQCLLLYRFIGCMQRLAMAESQWAVQYKAVQHLQCH